VGVLIEYGFRKGKLRKIRTQLVQPLVVDGTNILISQSILSMVPLYTAVEAMSDGIRSRRNRLERVSPFYLEQRCIGSRLILRHKTFITTS